MNSRIIARHQLGFPLIFAVFGMVLAAVASSAQADDARSTPHFDGRYSNSTLTVDLSESAGAYVGSITRGDSKFPLTATSNGTAITGTYTAAGATYDFTATLAGNQLILNSNGKTYTLSKAAGNPLDPAPAGNPLDSAAGANPSAPAPSNKSQLPAGYDLLHSTDYGQVLGTDKPKATDVKTALESSFPELTQFFGEQPKVGVAYDDTKHQSGGATFTVNYNGQLLKGVATCNIGDQGARVVIIFCRMDAPADAWEKLAAIPAPAAAANAAPAKPAPAAQPVPALTPYTFPDQTGTIGVADGWKIDAPSIFNTIRIEGPAGQNITLGSVMMVTIPGSQTEQSEDHFHMKHLSAPFSDPATAIQDIWPQISKFQQAAGGPAVQIDKIISEDAVKTFEPEDKASLIIFDITRTANGQSTQYRTEYVIRMHTIANQPGHWQLAMRGFSAPVETFDQNVPTMFAMMASLKVDEAVTAKVGKQKMDENAAVAKANLDAFIQRGIQQQKDHDADMARMDAEGDKRNADFAEQQLRKSRNDEAQCDAILNLTKIVDTRTGETAKVGIMNEDQVLDSLNQGAPNRFRQLQLSEQLDGRLHN